MNDTKEEFLSEEYTNWLNRLFSREINVVLQVEYDMNKFNILFKYVEEYLNNNLASPEEKDYYLNNYCYYQNYHYCYYYNFTYNNMYIEVTKLTNDDLRSYNPVISSYLVANLNDKTNVKVPPIDLNKVREYVYLKNQKENEETLNAIIKTVKELENKGIERDIILNDLQIAYAYVANKEIREKNNFREGQGRKNGK